MNTIFRPRMALAALVAAAATFALSACSEPEQTAHTPKTDTRPFEGPATAYTAPGWKAGDQAAWNTQLQVRTQRQNESVRIGQQPTVQR